MFCRFCLHIEPYGRPVEHYSHGKFIDNGIYGFALAFLQRPLETIIPEHKFCVSSFEFFMIEECQPALRCLALVRHEYFIPVRLRSVIVFCSFLKSSFLIRSDSSSECQLLASYKTMKLSVDLPSNYQLST